MPATPIATYRLQLRDGVDLDRARDLLPWLTGVGVSHLYLAPPFHAAGGSTHGYDVIDPTRIDPVLGGDDAFIRLSDAARDAGIGIIVDIVPNHMAFTPENPWLADVMRHGPESGYAKVFDIDWTRGPLHFPVLDETLGDLLSAGRIALSGSDLMVYDRAFPLRADGPVPKALDAASLHDLLAHQHWSLGHWRDSADRIVHRRFFNITDLIGVRQEDPDVFALTHSWIVEQVASGRVQGLRVDHIDGLAQPGGYLRALREAVGETPVWIEKIVKPGESIPVEWPTEGMSGYEFITPVTRLLTDAEGLAALRRATEGAAPASTADEVRKIRRELLDRVFTPELARVTDAAVAALAGNDAERPVVAEAIARLAIAWPVYRSYAADLAPLSDQIVAVTSGIDDPSAAALLDLLRAGIDPCARAFAARFEQLTGALTAKSEEDTVFFRSIAYLPLCEVGSEPDLEPIDAAQFTAAMAFRADAWPLALNTLSTHDTKRSADARAVLIALTRFPDLARRLYAHGRKRAADRRLPEGWGVYAMQTALMLYGEPEAEQRIAAHIVKAMREAKDISRHEAPEEAAEAAVIALCQTFHRELDTLIEPNARAAFDAVVEAVVLAQVALQLTAPGIPDVYQGTERVAVALTDPDNRRPVQWEEPAEADRLSARKLALTRELLARRRAAPELFAKGSYEIIDRGDAWEVHRAWQGEEVMVHIGKPSSAYESRAPA